jgi:IclR family transcriptional regulator, KDG regulon repressor
MANERRMVMSERLIQSIERAADVLELFLTNGPELSVKEISDKLQLSKSTVHGMIKTLEHRGYLQQNPEDLKYRLGIKLFTLGNFVGKHLDISRRSK